MQEVDVLIADTSGRLHTNVNLMSELQKARDRGGGANDIQIDR
jgi:signal recognition particle GTPase